MLLSEGICSGGKDKRKRVKKLRDKSLGIESFIYILPLILAASVVPLIVLMKNIPLDELSKQNWPSDINNDFFSYYKARMIIISSVGAIITVLIKYYQKRIHLKEFNIFIPVVIYSFFVILSAAFSEYTLISVYGFADRYEGALVLLSYMVLLLAGPILLDEQKQMKIFLAFLFASSAVIAFIGIFQFFGLDFFRSMLGQLLILPAEHHEYAGRLSFAFGEYTIYSTLYNTNFVGSYMAMLFPIALVLFIMVKKKIHKIPLGVLTALLYANWIGCRSRAGYLGGILALFVITIFLRKELLKNIKTVIVAVVLFIVIFGVMDIVSDGSLTNRDYFELYSDTLKEDRFGFEDIILEGERISIAGLEEVLSIQLIDGQMHFLDTNGGEIFFRSESSSGLAPASELPLGEELNFIDPRYEGITIIIYERQEGINIAIDNKQFYLYVNEKGFNIAGQRGKLVNKLEKVDSFGFTGRETLGSSRGYIWSRSIPLLKDYVFVGCGPDSYAFVFPQSDIVGKLKAFNKSNEIVDKPHNLYLQIAINTGVLSLIAIIVLFAIYLTSCVKLYIRCRLSNIYEVIGIAVFAAICGYLAAAFFNDSLVSVAPVFWVLLGLGFSCNYLNYRDIMRVQII